MFLIKARMQVCFSGHHILRRVLKSFLGILSFFASWNSTPLQELAGSSREDIQSRRFPRHFSGHRCGNFENFDGILGSAAELQLDKDSDRVAWHSTR